MQHEQIQKWDEECKKALEEIEHLSRDEKFRWVYEDRLKGILDYYSGLKSKFREGLQKGRQEGEQAGLEKGRQEGLQEGEQIGLEKGLQEGLEKGLEEGFSQGEQTGLEKGMQTGEQIGLLKSAKKMLKAGMTPQEVADILDLSVQDIQNLNP